MKKRLAVLLLLLSNASAFSMQKNSKSQYILDQLNHRERIKMNALRIILHSSIGPFKSHLDQDYASSHPICSAEDPTNQTYETIYHLLDSLSLPQEKAAYTYTFYKPGILTWGVYLTQKDVESVRRLFEKMKIQ